MSGRGHRVAFADQLRGLAALLVVLSHHGGLFWHAQPVAASLTGLPPAFEASPPLAGYLSSLMTGVFQPGPAGVALFFLISGYVIPFSLRGRGRGSFLLARLVRLVPTYWAGFAVQLAVLLVMIRLLGGTFPRSLGEVALNLLPGPHMLTWSASLDGIVWTLDVEVWFYLAMALAAPALLAGSAWVLAVPAVAGLVGAVLAVDTGWLTGIPPALTRALLGLSVIAPMMLFMSIGTVLHLVEVDRRWWRPALLLIPIMLAGFAALMRWWPTARMDAQVPSYFAMAALFIVAWRLRERVPAWRWPTWLAAISYPLYVVHGVSGYAIMIGLAAIGWPPFAMFLAAIGYALLMAAVLHRWVEEPTRRLSARLGRRSRRPEEK